MASLPVPLGAASSGPVLRAALQNHLLREKDDEVVVAFGPDYFHGVRAGAGFGGLFTATWCYWVYRRLKYDQHQADFEVGLRRGQRNPNFSRWVLARGLRTQPMLTIGCCTLFATTLFKAAKTYLAHRRCLEFMLDDVEFAMLARMSKEDPVTRELFEKLCRDAAGDAAAAPVTTQTQRHRTPVSAAASYKSVESMMRDDAALAAVPMSAVGSWRRPPTYWDGVAVGLMGSIMDCYMPMKPMNRYYGMRFGAM